MFLRFRLCPERTGIMSLLDGRYLFLENIVHLYSYARCSFACGEATFSLPSAQSNPPSAETMSNKAWICSWTPRRSCRQDRSLLPIIVASFDAGRVLGLQLTLINPHQSSPPSQLYQNITPTSTFVQRVAVCGFTRARAWPPELN
jgi:hypothetical protein